MLKRKLEDLGIPSQGPRDALRKAWQNGLLSSDGHIEAVWIEMIRDRNLTVPTYDEGFAPEMVGRIRLSYTPAFESLWNSLTLERRVWALPGLRDNPAQDARDICETKAYYST